MEKETPDAKSEYWVQKASWAVSTQWRSNISETLAVVLQGRPVCWCECLSNPEKLRVSGQYTFNEEVV